MVFSSALFLVFFFPILLVTYYLTPNRFKNIVLLIFSIFFYAWGAPKFIFVLLGTTFVDFHVVKYMDSITDRKKRRLFLLIPLLINVGLLFYFKYANFFIDNVNEMVESMGGKPMPLLNVIMPIGISFYTFETLTYVVDVYRKVHKPLNHFWNYQLYIILFPKLIAGPIIRYHEISDQITERFQTETIDEKLTGFLRFCLGLGKKVLIANAMGEYADTMFSMPLDTLSSGTAWLGALAYTFQIYFDFSGYSDMAIGIGLMLGFRFPENFNNPYTSQSITEFWRRWHMTLGSWMRNYLYIPLGGNRVSKTRLYFNLWLVFLLSGLWHGAAWTFIAWGAYHGLFLILDRLFLEKILQKGGKLIAIPFTFLITIFGWVLFRSENINQTLTIWKQMFSFDFSISYQFLEIRLIVVLAIAIFFSFFTSTNATQSIQNYVYGTKKSMYAHGGFILLAFVLFFISLGNILTSDYNPFIYFRF
jgi:alginate O-acetyltransferase complex protein AlgI